MRHFLALALLLVFFSPSLAITYTVTNCSGEVGTDGSLPWALDQIRSSSDTTKIIEFNIPTTEAGYITTEVTGVGFWRIQPADRMQVFEDIEIKGSTQTTNLGDTNPYGPEIEIDGSNLPASTPIFYISGNNNTAFEQLIINNSKSHGIHAVIGNTQHIYGCYIGTDATGEVARANAGSGLYFDNSGGNIIGGNSASQRNIISGNTGSGIEFDNSTYTTMQGNYIGTDRSGQNALGNAGSGIYIHSGSHHQYVHEYNTIANNGSGGIRVNGSSTDQNTFTQNSFFSNTGQAILLESGANNSVPYTRITTSEYFSSFGILYVQGDQAPANSTIEIMKIATPGTETRGEGKVSLGFALADANGNWFNYFATNEVQPGEKVSALATDASGNTSEFAENLAAITGTVIYRPDGMIGNASNGSDYLGENIFNTTGYAQTKEQSIFNTQGAIYYIKVKNAGNISPDNIQITGTGDTSGWQVKYYDAKTGGNDITGQVTGTGHISSAIPSAESYEFRIEVISTGSTLATKEVLVTLASASNPSRLDVVKAVTCAQPPVATDQFTFVITAPTTCEADEEFKITVTAYDAAGSVTTEVVGATTILVDQGTVAPSNIDASAFSQNGIWNGAITLDTVGTRTITLSNAFITQRATAVIEVQVPGYVVSGGPMRFGPNPFNPGSGQNAVFWYWLNQDKATILYIFDMQGNNLYKQVFTPGSEGGKRGVNAVSWNGQSVFGEILPNGVYFYRIVQDNKILYKGKLVILK